MSLIHSKPPFHTWTTLSVVAGSCALTTAPLATVYGRGVAATASVHAMSTSDGALIAPFGPVPISHGAVVIQAAPVGLATDRQAERVDAGETASHESHATALLAP